eukprot:CAMPEP_0181237536 /NCGR_PEP_ID=MMETSP1096-20121128/38819_1 /TAXON_ID=156174 ORGANISM="Chrysochromulina ericina, Strain CCMP281" /NCGR_SAMPLE_ID=MMETSP1096 /ASSEMBLY_ACC=CAM_ASM_000453 /LENGTH=121 /DNA_ID=CAMNT_0023332905 /DNA_START=234 /DNA_END=596 /DNA_ORIENTATION=+
MEHPWAASDLPYGAEPKAQLVFHVLRVCALIVNGALVIYIAPAKRESVEEGAPAAAFSLSQLGACQRRLAEGRGADPTRGAKRRLGHLQGLLREQWELLRRIELVRCRAALNARPIVVGRS